MKFLPSRNIRASAALLLACAALPAPVDARHENILPAHTYAAVQIRDTASLKNRLEKHPILADLKKLNLEAYFQPLLNALGAEAMADAESRRFIRFLEEFSKAGGINGEIAVAVSGPEKFAGEKEAPVLIFIADMSMDEAGVRDLFTKVHGDKKGGLEAALDAALEKTVFHGVNLYSLAIPPKKTDGKPDEKGGSLNFAVVGKTFALSSTPDALRDTVDALLNNGRRNSLASTKAWKRGAEAFAKSEVFSIVNTPFAASRIRDFVVAESAKEGANNLFAVDHVKAYDTLALDSLEGLWCSVECAPDKILLKYSVAHSGKRGVLTLLPFKPLGTFVPDFIPAKKHLSWSTQRFDFAEAWKNFDVLLGQALPTLKPMFDAQINQIKVKEGLDVRRAILENFGDRLAIVTDPRGAASKALARGDVSKKKDGSSPGDDLNEFLMGSFVCVVDVLDTGSLNSFIDTAVGKLGKGGEDSFFTTREFKGVKIRTVRETLEGDSPSPVSYALENGKLFIGFNAEELLNEVLAESKAPTRALARDPVIAQALEFVPKNAAAFSAEGAHEIINFLSGVWQVATLKHFAKSPAGQGEKPAIRPLSTSLETFPWFISGWMESRPNEIYGQSVFFRIKDK
ncbi:MAG: hypothetical protein LBG65_01095 [Puniceicoccales bacterium]|jgi:hypothetical protein|nr:hypothetical protein [Puniceicoccales bacterium]